MLWPARKACRATPISSRGQIATAARLAAAQTPTIAIITTGRRSRRLSVGATAVTWRRGEFKLPSLDFWYEFASTYSYPAAMRIGNLAEAAGVDVRWRPFLLGPIFAEQGWSTSPFNLHLAKGRYMWRDLERICASRGLAFRRPDPFPQNSLLAARVATALDGESRREFSRAVYAAEFAAGSSIADPACIAVILEGLGESAGLIERAATEPVKSELRNSVEEAKRLGIFGAPTFVTADGELFWGDDRLEAALDWAVTQA